MRLAIAILLIQLALVTCHNVVKREIDEEGYDWDAGVPHYEHFHYTHDGDIDFAPRIIGGMPSFHGEFPAKISVQTTRGAHICGGALIDLRHVLTAAHCLTTTFGAVLDLTSLQFMGDDISIQRWGSTTRQIRFPSHFFVHPSFNVRTFDADIALVRTILPFTASDTLRAMPRSFITPMDGLNCQLAGWGTTDETNTRAHPILLRIEIPIIPMIVCNGTNSFNGLIPTGFICAGTMDGSRDACAGDSGGALICSGEIAGIVSFGFGCGRRNFPGAYVDVSQFNHWIAESLASNLPNNEIPRPPVISPDPNSVAKVFVSTKLIILAVVFALSLFTQ